VLFRSLERQVGDDVLAWIERFWRTDFARGLSPETVLRELPFVLRLEHDGGPALLLRGQIDLLVVTQNELLVIDYKTSTQPPAGLEPYRFQLACYALAARRFVHDPSRPVRAGVVFLQDPSPEPQFFDSLALPRFAATLVAEARALELAQRTGRWEGQPRKVCESLGCGYLSRCHP
jgi:RecB family exonuclease